MTHDASLELAVIICTYKREDLLSRALDSLIAQDMSPTLRPAVYVVDNSDDGGAARVVAAAAARSAFPVHWLEAHPPNISVARNAGVRASAEDHVAFIDDDETAEPGWFNAVETAFRAHSFDVMFGGVEPDFEAPERVTPAILTLFSRRLAEPAGFELYAFGQKKLSTLSLATNNSLYRRASTLGDAEPFDPAFGNCGGEDYDLFCRLQKRGRRFGWAPQAVVREFVPASRCDRRYLFRRFYAGGQAAAAILARNATARVDHARWMLRARALVQAGLLALYFPVALAKGRAALTDYVFRFAGVFGKLSLGGLYPLYRSQDK